MDLGHFENTLFIVRGIPGSGKTSLVRFIQNLINIAISNEHWISHISVATDDYFIDHEGNYNFPTEEVKEELSKAHQWAVDKVDEEMILGSNIIFLHNTMSQSYEMDKYLDLCLKHNYTPFVIECQNDFTSTHGVPSYVVDAQVSRWQDSPTFNRKRYMMGL